MIQDMMSPFPVRLLDVGCSLSLTLDKRLLCKLELTFRQGDLNLAGPAPVMLPLSAECFVHKKSDVSLRSTMQT